MSQPKPPSDLGPEGRRLWRLITADAAGQDVDLTAAELTYLRQAGKLADTIALLEKALDDAELVVPGYMGKGTVGHPLLAELRQTRMLLGQTIARIDLDVPEAPGVSGGVGTSNRFRAAALSRWTRGGA